MRNRFSAIGVVAVLLLASVGRAQEAGKFDMTGTVQTGMMAIGGETTGTLLKTDKGTFELTAGANKEVAKQIAALSGKKAYVVGTLAIKEGVEVGQRKIVTVDTIEAAP